MCTVDFSARHRRNSIIHSRNIGFENHWFEILASDIPEDRLDIDEILAIYLHDSFHNGLNATAGGEGNRNPKSAETKRKMSEAAKGKPKTEEHKLKIAQSQKGKQKPWMVERNKAMLLGKPSPKKGKKYPKEFN
jgi:ribosomal protein L12E/L44/L45/RPP1/RPP2